MPRRGGLKWGGEQGKKEGGEILTRTGSLHGLAVRGVLGVLVFVRDGSSGAKGLEEGVVEAQLEALYIPEGVSEWVAEELVDCEVMGEGEGD